jgi:tetratricopeptide (TPR) repeat protein
MEQLTLTNKLKGMGKEFFLQTSADPENGNGACILFEDGNPLDVFEFKLTDNGRTPASAVEDYHRSRMEKFVRLSELYTELTDETDPSILEKLAQSLSDQKLHQEAIEIFTRAIDVAPQQSRFLNSIGLIYFEIEDFEKARDNFLKAIQISPDYPDYQHNLGRTLLSLGKCYQAYKSFEKAIELNVYFAEAYFNMAMALILNGIRREDYNLAQNLEDNATGFLAKAVGFNPLFKNDHLQKGVDALGNKDLQAAFRSLSRAYDEAIIGKFPKKTYYFHLDYLFRNSLLKEESVIRHIKKLQKLIEAHPNFPDLHNELGMAYTVLAQFHSDRAIEAYEKALKINPNYKTALKNLKLIQNELKGLKTLLRAILK